MVVKYLGKVDRPKGILKTDTISRKIIPFEQDVNYYFQKGSYYHQKNKFSKALLFLRKAIEVEPLNAHNHYNLACLLSKTNQLAEANRIFRHIVGNLNSDLHECYFLMAINCGLMEDMDRAKRYLLKYLSVSPDGEMSEEARDLLLAMEEDDDEFVEHNHALTVQDNEAFEQVIAGLSDEQLREQLMHKDFRQALQRGLYQGSDSLKERIIRLYGKVHNQTTHSSLREYVISPWVKERLRQIALLELKDISTVKNCRIFNDGRIVEIDLSDYPPKAPLWRDEWQEVLDFATANMRKSAYYGEEFFNDLREIWLDFINNIYPHMPRILKPQTWAAGLEYCLARFHFLDVTQKELAIAYAVSLHSVGRIYKQINRVLHIDQKAYRNMLTFLAHQDRERN